MQLSFFHNLAPAIAMLAIAVSGSRYEIDQVSIIWDGTEPWLRTCAYVATQAFSQGWLSRGVTFQAGTYLRWGQKKCVFQVQNKGSFPVTLLGNGLRTALIETMDATASTYTRGGNSHFSLVNNVQSIYFTYAHSDRFGGDIGTPQKRDVNASAHNEEGLTRANATSNEFAAHLATMDFEEMEQQSYLASNITLDIAETDNAKVLRAVRDLDERALAKRTVIQCTPAMPEGTSAFWECGCYNDQLTLFWGNFDIVCSAEKSASGTWTRNAFRSAVSETIAMATNINNANVEWAPGVTLNSATYKGAVLFTPHVASGVAAIHPVNSEMRCCGQMLNNAVDHFGFASSQCTCDNTSGDNTSWHLFLSDSVLLGNGQ